MLVSGPKEDGEKPYIDFNTSLTDFEQQIRKLVPTQNVDQSANLKMVQNPGRFEFRVGWVRGKMAANKALELNSNANVMLVDPISDYAEQYKQQALDVIVVDVPNLHSLRTQIEIGKPKPPAKPVPTPDPSN